MELYKYFSFCNVYSISCLMSTLISVIYLVHCCTIFKNIQLPYFICPSSTLVSHSLKLCSNEHSVYPEIGHLSSLLLPLPSQLKPHHLQPPATWFLFYSCLLQCILTQHDHYKMLVRSWHSFAVSPQQPSIVLRVTPRLL